jgi:branched-chain amino acid transport system permease protein
VAQNLVNALSLGSLYALLALGVALVFSIMGLINFAHGDLLMLVGYLLLAFAAFPPAFAIGLAIAAAVVAAVGMERVAFRPARGASPMTLLMTSFAVSSLLEGVALLVEGARPKSVDVLPRLSSSFEVVGVSVGWLDLATTATTAVALAVLAWFLRSTLLGLQMRAAAESFAMARALGVRANRIVASAFAVSGGLAGIAALFYVARTGTLTPSMGFGPVLIAFVATVIGGMGRLWAAALGGYILGFLSVGLQAYLPSGLVPYRDAFVFLGVIAILQLRPQGIAGRPESVRV